MIAAFAGLQKWDGVYVFAYLHNSDDQPGMVSSYFDIKADPTRLVHMPACHALFVRGDVEPARTTRAVPISKNAEMAKLVDTFNPRSLTTDDFGLDSLFSLQHAIGVTLTGERGKPLTHGIALEDTRRYVSDTDQLVWDLSKNAGGFFVADTMRTKLFTGFVSNQTLSLGDVQLRIGETRLNWATVSMVCIDGPGFSQPGRILVAATGWAQNSNAQLETLHDNRVTLGARWGDPPVLCEGVSATVSLSVPSSRVRCYPLDEAGNRRAAVPVQASGEQAMITLSPIHKTLWYEVEIQ